MYTELLIQLSPLKMIFFGLLFFIASWMVSKKILFASVIGLTAGETTLGVVRDQLAAFGSNPLALQAAAAAGMPIRNGSIMASLIANVLLALAMMCLVQAIKLYSRAKRVEMEQHLRILEVQGNAPFGPRRQR